MARRTKDASGRVTPKGGAVRAQHHVEAGRPVSGRYTAPIPREFRTSPRWVPILMLTLFGLGLICILLNYLGGLPGGANNGYLLLGLGLIIFGFITATQYR